MNGERYRSFDFGRRCGTGCGSRSCAALILLVHAFRHELFDVQFSIPSVVRLDEAASIILLCRPDFGLVVVGKVALAGDVSE
jgi:hypothetical protein